MVAQQSRPPSARAEDDRVAELLATGTDDALRAVYDRYGALVYTYCMRQLGVGGAADAAQEVFIAAWQGRARFDPSRASLASWLLGIARHKVVDALRAQGRRPEPVADTETAPATEPGVDDEIAGRLLVLDALDALDERPRQVLALTLFEGRTNQQVADRLQIPVGTVKSDIRRGLQRLRARSEPDDGAR